MNRENATEGSGSLREAEDHRVDGLTVITLIGIAVGGLATIIFLLEKFLLEKDLVSSALSEEDEDEILEEDALVRTAGNLASKAKKRSIRYLDHSDESLAAHAPWSGIVEKYRLLGL
jgi:hypothetical protein